MPPKHSNTQGGANLRGKKLGSDRNAETSTSETRSAAKKKTEIKTQSTSTRSVPPPTLHPQGRPSSSFVKPSELSRLLTSTQRVSTKDFPRQVSNVSLGSQSSKDSFDRTTLKKPTRPVIKRTSLPSQGSTSGFFPKPTLPEQDVSSTQNDKAKSHVGSESENSTVQANVQNKTIILVKECQNSCGAEIIELQDMDDVQKAIHSLYSQNGTSVKSNACHGAYSMSRKNYLSGKHLIDELITEQEKNAYRVPSEAESLIASEKSKTKEELAELVADQCFFYKNIGIENLKDSDVVVHALMTSKIFEKLTTNICENRLSGFELHDAYKVLKQSRPYIYKALSNLEEMSMYEKKAAYFVANSDDHPAMVRDIGLLNWLKNKTLLEEIESTKNCLEKSMLVLANIRLIQMASKNLQRIRSCEGKVFTDFHRDLQTLEQTMNRVIDHSVMFPDHMQTLICAMGYASKYSADNITFEREQAHSYSTISGREYEYIVNQEREDGYKKTTNSRKKTLKACASEVMEKSNVAAERGDIQDIIMEEA